LILNKNQADY